MISLLKSNVNSCLNTLKPIFDIFQFPISESVLTIEKINCVLEMFPSKVGRPDVYALQAEMEMLLRNCTNTTRMGYIIQKSKEMKEILKLAFKLIQFVMTASVSVATNERKFSQLKLVKTLLRSTMADDRLNALLMLASEKDLTDKIDRNKIVSRWGQLKHRRIRVV